jgi:hypothetical protein
MVYEMLKSAINQYQNKTIFMPFLRRCSNSPVLDAEYEKKGNICEHLEKLGTQVYGIHKYYKGEKLKLKLIHVILNKYNIDVLLDNNIYEYLCEIKDKSCEYAFPRKESQYLHYKAARTKRLIYYTLSFNPERKTSEMLSEVYENSESDHERYKYDCVLNVYH